MVAVTNKHILVIGGTGFIGSHLLQAAKDKKWKVYSLSLTMPPKEKRVEYVNYLVADITDRTALSTVLSDHFFNYVVNLGGYVDHTLMRLGGDRILDIHFSGVRNVLDLLNRDHLVRFVQIGSSDEYGTQSSPQREASRERPISPYALGKTAVTHLLQMLQRTELFPSVILRLFLTYGPGQSSDRFLPQIIRGCLADEKFPVSAGMQLRDFCYVSDTVTAIISALEIPDLEGEVINVASGQPISIRKVIEKICFKIGSGHPQYGEIPYRPEESMELFADTRKAKSLLSWQPRIFLDSGLDETILWYRHADD